MAVAAAGLTSAVLRGCPEADAPPAPIVFPDPPMRFIEFVFPTAQTNLLADGAEGVFMPTVSGRLESALFGTTRTGVYGKQILPRFHEGIDIAPVHRDGSGAAMDDILAAADGRVAHINAVAGNSSYGIYVVMVHDDPAGPLYTLYAHMNDVDSGLRRDMDIPRGTRLGRMGRTPTAIIPVERSHLHYEVGVALNPHFRQWFASKRLKPDHGNYNGMNLFGIDPLIPYRVQASGNLFSLASYMMSTPPAFEVILAGPRRPLYFTSYPGLWQGEPHQGGAVVVAATESGAPMRGRNATGEEIERLGKRKAAVLSANPDVLGRNGRRLVVQSGGQWTIGSSGNEWLEILTYR